MTTQLIALTGPTLAHAVPNRDYVADVESGTVSPMGTFTDRYGCTRWLALSTDPNEDYPLFAYTSLADCEEYGEICSYAATGLTLAVALS